MDKTFVHYVDSARGESPAIEDDQRRMTYAELMSAVRKIASYVDDRWGKENYVVLRAHSTVSFAATFFGIMASGNTPVPIDPHLPHENVRFIESKSRAVAVLDPLDPSDYADRPQRDFARTSMPAVIMFTSGTSGFPKGVIIKHDGLHFACRAIADYLNYHVHASAAVVLPLHYSYALLSQLCCQLYAGGYVRLFSNLRNPIKLAKQATSLGLETFCGVPTTFAALDIVHKMARLSFPKVRVVCSAGAPMDYSRLSLIKEIFPNSKVFNNYGMTEAAPRISFISDSDPRFLQNTCGRPMRGVEVKVVDPVTHRELPDGEAGVLVVRGPNITPGYLHDPELTRQSFTSDGYLVSGDVASLNNGYITIVGRTDDVFNVGGEKVAPAEVERVLNGLSFVSDSAVRGVSEAGRGMIPVAFLKLTDLPVAVTRRLLHDALAAQLPPAKIPQRFFEVRAFPTTSNGKLLRRRLDVEDPELIVREIV